VPQEGEGQPSVAPVALEPSSSRVNRLLPGVQYPVNRHAIGRSRRGAPIAPADTALQDPDRLDEAKRTGEAARIGTTVEGGRSPRTGGVHHRLDWTAACVCSRWEKTMTGNDAETGPRIEQGSPRSTGPVRSVSVVSTGSVEIHPQQVNGSRLPMMVWLIGSRRWTPPRPINAYVVEHADGLVLFDTGQDRASVTDPGYFPGGVTGFLYGRLARFQIAKEETLAAKLAAIGYDAGDVRLAILSHLHQDHIGGVRSLAGAELIVAETEWRAMEQPRSELDGFLRRHIDLPGVRFRRIGFTPTDDPALAPFTRMTSWATARSSCCRFPATPQARRRCSSAGRTRPRCSWSAT
jgi:hypothetical protein